LFCSSFSQWLIFLCCVLYRIVMAVWPFKPRC
ncbi:hypothetical protein T10_8147, partial [Trichinella papuae]